MMERKDTILLLGSGTQALAIVSQLAKAGYRILILTNEKGNYADVSRFVEKRIVHGSTVDSSSFCSFFIELIKEEKVQLVIPMGDIYAEFLSKNKKELQSLTKFIVPDYVNFLNGYDKNKLMSLCKEKNYPHPQTIDLTKVASLKDESLKTFPYPAMLKPNCTTGGRGMVRIESYDELLSKYPSLHESYGEYHLQRFIAEGGKQVKVQLCVDKDGNLLNSSVLQKVRWYPVKGGASSCSITIENPAVVSTCHQILQDIGWEGFADFDLIEDPSSNELLIMEINPRLPACIGAAIRGGINWGEIIVNQILEKEQCNYDYKKGVVLRHLGFDILWFLKSSNKFNTRPSWFDFFGKNVYYQDFQLRDQRPFWIGTLHNIRKLLNPSFRKQKQGL